MPRAACRKRPCKICRRWFLPNPRVGNRQKTCNSPECKTAWHRKQCAKWYRGNKDYFKANYLHRKLAGCSEPAFPSDSKHGPRLLPASRIQLHLPRSDIAEVMTAKAVIVIEYILAQAIARIHSTITGTGSRKPSPTNNSP
jgi:hypothetical protein